MLRCQDDKKYSGYIETLRNFSIINSEKNKEVKDL